MTEVPTADMDEPADPVPPPSVPDGHAEVGAAEAPPEGTKSSGRNIAEWVIVLVGAVLIAGLIRAVLFQAFYIPSPSMNPTLVQNDRVIVNKLSYRLHDVHRGDVIVFSRPPGVPQEDKDLIKRVVGLPGETVSLKGGRVYINGTVLAEPYTAKGSTSDPLSYPTCTADLSKPLVVPKNTVFVMGDNRNQSLDGRCFGPIPQSHIVGRAFVLIWPLSDLQWL